MTVYEGGAPVHARRECGQLQGPAAARNGAVGGELVAVTTAAATLWEDARQLACGSEWKAGECHDGLQGLRLLDEADPVQGVKLAQRLSHVVVAQRGRKRPIAPVPVARLGKPHEPFVEEKNFCILP